MLSFTETRDIHDRVTDDYPEWQEVCGRTRSTRCPRGGRKRRMAASSSRDVGVSIEEYDELKGKFEDLQIESHKLKGQLKAKEG